MNDTVITPEVEQAHPPADNTKRTCITCAAIFGVFLVAGVLLAVAAGIFFGPRLVAAYHERRGISFAEQGDFESAMRELDQATRLNPKSATAYYYRSILYFAQGDSQQAFQEINQAINLSPDYADAYFQRGFMLIEMEEYLRAVADYDRVIELDPSAMAYNNRCWAYLQMGEPGKALPDCEIAIEMEPDDVATLDSRARVYSALGRKEEAIADFQRIIELDVDPDLSWMAAEEIKRLER